MGRSGHRSRASATLPVRGDAQRAKAAVASRPKRASGSPAATREKRTPLDVRTFDDYIAGRGLQLPLDGVGEVATELDEGLIRFNDPDEMRRQRDRLMRRLRKAMKVKPMIWFNGDSDFVNPAVVAMLEMGFGFHHAMNGDLPVAGKQLEGMMFEALGQATSVFKPEDQTNVGFDLLVSDRVRLSLKSTESKSVQPHHMPISKLMEAAWCKTLRSRPDCVRSIPRILEHLDTWDRMLMLRSSKLPKNGGWVYELLEVPKEIFTIPLAQLTSKDFSLPTAKHRSYVHVEVEGKHLYKLTLDGSVGKVSIDNLATDICPVHAIWHLPASSRVSVRPRVAMPMLNPQVHKPATLSGPAPLPAALQSRRRKATARHTGSSRLAGVRAEDNVI